MPEKVCEFEFCISLYFPTPPRLGVIIWGTDKICQRSAPVWLMSVLQIQQTIPYNARKAVKEVCKIEAGKGVIGREDMEMAFPPVLSNLNPVVVAGYGPVEKRWARGQHNINHGAKAYLLSPRDNSLY